MALSPLPAAFLQAYQQFKATYTDISARHETGTPLQAEDIRSLSNALVIHTPEERFAEPYLDSDLDSDYLLKRETALYSPNKDSATLNRLDDLVANILQPSEEENTLQVNLNAPNAYFNLDPVTQNEPPQLFETFLKFLTANKLAELYEKYAQTDSGKQLVKDALSGKRTHDIPLEIQIQNNPFQTPTGMTVTGWYESENLIGSGSQGEDSHRAIFALGNDRNGLIHDFISPTDGSDDVLHEGTHILDSRYIDPKQYPEYAKLAKITQAGNYIDGILPFDEVLTEENGQAIWTDQAATSALQSQASLAEQLIHKSWATGTPYDPFLQQYFQKAAYQTYGDIPAEATEL